MERKTDRRFGPRATLTTVNHHARLMPELHEAVAAYAEREGISLNEATVRLLTAGLREAARQAQAAGR